MLIQADSLFSQCTLVAIGVDEWSINGEYRCFDLVPYENETDTPFVEVGVITTRHKPKAIAPAMPDWGAHSQRFIGENESGYPLTKEAAEDLYYVWDDGARGHMERAQRLYRYYKDRAEHYREAALKFHLEQYKKRSQVSEREGMGHGAHSKTDSLSILPASHNTF